MKAELDAALAENRALRERLVEEGRMRNGNVLFRTLYVRDEQVHNLRDQLLAARKEIGTLQARGDNLAGQLLEAKKDIESAFAVNKRLSGQLLAFHKAAQDEHRLAEETVGGLVAILAPFALHWASDKRRHEDEWERNPDHEHTVLSSNMPTISDWRNAWQAVQILTKNGE
jgi:hypothetical protein